MILYFIILYIQDDDIVVIHLARPIGSSFIFKLIRQYGDVSPNMLGLFPSDNPISQFLPICQARI